MSLLASVAPSSIPHTHTLRVSDIYTARWPTVFQSNPTGRTPATTRARKKRSILLEAEKTTETEETGKKAAPEEMVKAALGSLEADDTPAVENMLKGYQRFRDGDFGRLSHKLKAGGRVYPTSSPPPSPSTPSSYTSLPPFYPPPRPPAPPPPRPLPSPPSTSRPCLVQRYPFSPPPLLLQSSSSFVSSCSASATPHSPPARTHPPHPPTPPPPPPPRTPPPPFSITS